ncbi:MAG: 2-oxoacid:ferredoxin oxidoreductase subunit gamma [Deltaproteobacteria bacterium]|nr:2-oxoacid:ferredoxin oxidoreductase subunit gamma [Deltaproteobacteria bacterium]
MRKEIIFAGSGGQGIITASIILAEAIAIHEGHNVVQCQSYGPEARGGSSSSHVIINYEREVGYPKAMQPQIMICLTQEALDKFSHLLRPGGIMLTDRYHARRLKQLDARVYNLHMYTAVKERIGQHIVFSICVLGALVGLTGIARPESVKKVIAARVPEHFLRPNEAAFDLGMELAAGARIWRADLPEEPHLRGAVNDGGPLSRRDLLSSPSSGTKS